MDCTCLLIFVTGNKAKKNIPKYFTCSQFYLFGKKVVFKGTHTMKST